MEDDVEEIKKENLTAGTGKTVARLAVIWGAKCGNCSTPIKQRQRASLKRTYLLLVYVRAAG